MKTYINKNSEFSVLKIFHSLYFKAFKIWMPQIFFFFVASNLIQAFTQNPSSQLYSDCINLFKGFQMQKSFMKSKTKSLVSHQSPPSLVNWTSVIKKQTEYDSPFLCSFVVVCFHRWSTVIQMEQEFALFLGLGSPKSRSSAAQWLKEHIVWESLRMPRRNTLLERL